MRKSLLPDDSTPASRKISAPVVSFAHRIGQSQPTFNPEPQTDNQALLEQQACAELFMPTSIAAGTSSLTPKELQLLELLSFGYENGDIAEHFQTSRQAVKNMLRTINLKLGADNRTHAVAICFRIGLLPLKPQP